MIATGAQGVDGRNGEINQMIGVHLGELAEAGHVTVLSYARTGNLLTSAVKEGGANSGRADVQPQDHGCCDTSHLHSKDQGRQNLGQYPEPVPGADRKLHCRSGVIRQVRIWSGGYGVLYRTTNLLAGPGGAFADAFAETTHSFAQLFAGPYRSTMPHVSGEPPTAATCALTTLLVRAADTSMVARIAPHAPAPLRYFQHALVVLIRLLRLRFLRQRRCVARQTSGDQQQRQCRYQYDVCPPIHDDDLPHLPVCRPASHTSSL
jgi:hypothetical protein